MSLQESSFHKQCVAIRVYPGRSDGVGLSVRVQGKDELLKGLDIWQMRNIYSIICVACRRATAIEMHPIERMRRN